VTVELFPPGLPVVTTVSRTEDGRSWLAGLPSLVEELRERWSLRLEAPFPGGSCSWVAPAALPDGSRVVLKVGWPHREAAGEGIALEAARALDGPVAAQDQRAGDRDRQRHVAFGVRADQALVVGQRVQQPARQ
jgi:hypothetical protein